MTADSRGREIQCSTEAASVLRSMPAAELFGFRFDARTEGEAAVALPLRREFLQGEGRVHGGVLAALADTSAVYLILGGVEASRTFTSIEFKLNFVRAVVLERGELVAHARYVKLGRTIALVEVEVFQSDAIVAKGLFTYLFSERRGGAGA